MKKMIQFFAAVVAVFALMVASAGSINYGAEQKEYFYVICGAVDFITLGYVLFRFFKTGGLKW